VAGRKALFQHIQFATDVNPIARIAHGLYKGGFLNAVSVGFIPLRWEDTPTGGTNSASPKSECCRRYLEQELLEVSAVAIPANPDALALGIKSGAITKSDLADTSDLVRCLSIDYGPGAHLTRLRASPRRCAAKAPIQLEP
jgi:phage head maturation protease